MSHKRSAKSQKRRKKRRQTQGPGARRATRPPPDDLNLLARVDHALSADHPMYLLTLVSMLVSLVDPRRVNPFERAKPDDSMSYDILLESFMDVDLPETTALLAVMAAMTSDELEAARIRRALANRDHALPPWLTGLADIQPYHVAELVHVLGDGDDVMIGARLPTGEELTAMVYIDHNLGTVVKDAFVLDEPIGAVFETMTSKVDDPDVVWRDVDPADARTRVTDAIATGAITYPPFESDTWPACRPIVEWLVRALPAGGRGYERPEWDDADRQRLLDDFFASRYGSALDDENHRTLLDTIVWFGTDYGPGDPLRWSPVAVEILLSDWIPRKIVADAAYLSLAPDLLRSFIRYCHDQRGIRPALTADTVAAVDRYEPDYQTAIRTPRLQGPMALLDAVGALDDADPDDDLDASFAEIMLDVLRREAGGDQALRTLDSRPLADEEFDWSVVPDDIRVRVEEVLQLCDRCCEELMDREHRTAGRRLLASVVSGDPDIFRRRGAAVTAAAAICWIIGKANGVFDSWGGGLRVQDMLSHFGVSGSVSARAGVMLRAAGLESGLYGAMDLGVPELLVSGRRAAIIEARDRYLEQRRVEQLSESADDPA